MTDKTEASFRFCKAHQVPLIQLKAGKESYTHKLYNLLQRINNLRGRLKDLLQLFKGVGTKYLDNYLAWNGFCMRYIGSTKMSLKDKLVSAMNSIGEYPTYMDMYKSLFCCLLLERRNQYMLKTKPFILRFLGRIFNA